MRSPYFRIITISCMVAVLALAVKPLCEARTVGKPVVVRKKIIIPAEENQKTIMPQPKPDLSGIDSDSEDDTNMDMETAYAGNEAPGYDPAGKIDPFEPLFKATSKDSSRQATYADTDTGGNTPLENIDLSQLKLTGIVQAVGGNKGLVREASGKGHIIAPGTRIGIHGGRVAEILSDRIIIKEKMKDVLGRIFFQKTEMKLNRNS
ncbi:MAG: pilus assembly protein PilP [Desulfobacterales bacterium]